MCTHFMLSVPAVPASDMVYVTARCLELSGHMPTSLYLVPRQQSFPLVPPPSPPASNPLKWSNQYGFVGVATDQPKFESLPCFMDGVNEAGLSMGALWLPGTVYPSSGSNPQVYFADFGAWVLGNFATVAELEPALSEISVVGPPTPSGGENPQHYFPLHFIATDATGASLVVEFVGGEMNVYPPSYDNGATSDGVLTNAPTYDWQRTNLANYDHLSVIGPATTLSGNGGPPVGSGLMGLPGDPTSASRFVRAATLRRGFDRLPRNGKGWLPAPGGTGTGYADPVRTVVNVAMQLVQMIQATPYGTTLELETGTEPKEGGSPAVQVGDWTMWWLVRDNTNRTLYFASAFNGILRSVDVSPDRFAGDHPGFPDFRAIPLMPQPESVPWFHEAHWDGQHQPEMQPA